MFKTLSVSYSFTFKCLRPSSKHSVTLPFYRFLWQIQTWRFRFYELDSHKSSSAPVVLLGLAFFFLQGLKLCLSFLLCNRTGRRWRAASKHYLSCWSRTHAAVLHFLSWITQGVSHFISESELRIYFPSHLLTQSKHETIHSQPTSLLTSFS